MIISAFPFQLLKMIKRRSDLQTGAKTAFKPDRGWKEQADDREYNKAIYSGSDQGSNSRGFQVPGSSEYRLYQTDGQAEKSLKFDHSAVVGCSTGQLSLLL